MGKKKVIDSAKKEALQAKKEAKAEKCARKRIAKVENKASSNQKKNKNEKDDVDDDDDVEILLESNAALDALLEEYRIRDRNEAGGGGAAGGFGGGQTAAADNGSSSGGGGGYAEDALLDSDGQPIPPPARANATLTLIDDGKRSMKKSSSRKYAYMFGGEYYDGIENIVLDQLYQFDLSTYQWRRIITNTTNNAALLEKEEKISSKDGKNSNSKGNNKKNKNSKEKQQGSSEDSKVSSSAQQQLSNRTPVPQPRCAHSTINHNETLYIFGGEYATTNEYYHYRDIWKLDMKVPIHEWKWEQIASPSSSKTMKRRNHQEEEGGGSLGGSTNTMSHSSSRMPISPSARSGHVSVKWKHYMIIFGGFYEALREKPVWYNDVYVFDLHTDKWIDIQHTKYTQRPEPRSACNVAIINNDQMLIHGGFTKVTSASTASGSGSAGMIGSGGGGSSTIRPTSTSFVQETHVHTDAWILHLKPILSNKSPTWERFMSSQQVPSSTAAAQQRKRQQQQQQQHGGSKKTAPASSVAVGPHGRSGTSSIAYKDRLMLVFGGVIDEELSNHRVNSVFYNDLYALDVQRRKWFPLRVQQKSSKNKNNKKKDTSSKRKCRRKDDDEHSDDEEHDEEKEEEKDDDDDDNDIDNEEEDLVDDDDDDDDDDDVVSQFDNGNDSNEPTGWDIEKLRSNMFAFIDGDGNIVYEKIEDDDSDNDNEEEKDEEKEVEEEEEEKDEEKEEERDNRNDDDVEEEEEEKDEEKESEAVDEHVKQDNNKLTTKMTEEEEDQQQQQRTRRTSKRTSARESQHQQQQKQKDEKKKISSSSVMTLDPNTKTPIAVTRDEPLPRIKASLLLNGHVLYVYGGILEVGDREITLDDLWSLDLRKRERWVCIHPGTMHKQVWRGAVNDDDDSYYSNTEKTVQTAEDEEDDYDDNDGDDDDEYDGRKEDMRSSNNNNNNNNDGLREEIATLNRQYDLIDDNRTPRSGEVLADFYSRTSEYWNEQASLALLLLSQSDNNNDDNKLQKQQQQQEEAKAADKHDDDDDNKDDDIQQDNHSSSASSSSSFLVKQELSAKELKREGFRLAQARYAQLEPIMERLKELDNMNDNAYANDVKEQQQQQQHSRRKSSSSKTTEKRSSTAKKKKNTRK